MDSGVDDGVPPRARASARALVEAGRFASFGLVLTCFLALGGCAGSPPWFLGSPRPGVSVPRSDRNPGIEELRVARRKALAAGQPWAELPLLRRLWAKGALDRAETARLSALLAERARDWDRRERPRAAWSVRAELVDLAPASPEVTAEALASSALRAARSWGALGAWSQGRSVLARADALLRARDASREADGLAAARAELADRSREARSWTALDETEIAPSPWAGPSDHVGATDGTNDALGVRRAAFVRELWQSASLTEAVDKGGPSFLRAMASRDDGDEMAEILREEDPTAAPTWEALAYFWFARGRPETARRALLSAAAYAPAPEAGWTRAAQLAEGAGETAFACQAWRRAASVTQSPWNPRWPRFLRCLEKAPTLGDPRAWVSFLAERVPESERVAYARWLGGEDGAATGGP